MHRRRGWRWWHTWSSFALALPLLIVALTALPIAHEGLLRWKDIPVAAGWLPGYAGGDYGPEVRAVHHAGGGQEFVATKIGLFVRTAAGMRPVAGLDPVEFRDVTGQGGTVLAAAKNGLWIGEAGGWRRAVKGEVWSISTGPGDAISIASKEHGILRSADGGTSWVRDDGLHGEVAKAAGAQSGPSLGTLIVDLHTGKALFGKTYEWVWIDLTGLTLGFLCVSGLVMWWRSQRRRLFGRRSPAGAGITAAERRGA